MKLLKSILFTFLGPGILTIAIPTVILHSGAALTLEIAGLRYVGLIVLIAGAGIACWCMWAFVAIGHGMPTSVNPPVEFVAKGLYRTIRNPMYAGVLLIIFGEAWYYASWALLLHGLLAWLALHLFVVRYEEPSLHRRFGAAYDRYVQTVPRWVPRVGAMKAIPSSSARSLTPRSFDGR